MNTKKTFLFDSLVKLIRTQATLGLTQPIIIQFFLCIKHTNRLKIGHRLLWDHFLHMQSDRNGSVLLLLMHKVEKKYINIHINSYIALVWWFSSTMKHHHPIWHKNRCAVIHFFYLYREYDNVARMVKLLPT